MSPAAGFSESVDRRVLGGLVFVDAMTNAVAGPLAVNSAQLQLKANRSGVYAILNAPGFTALTWQFLPTAATWPPPQKFGITVHDPSLRYLPRQAQVNAPQPLATLSTPQQIKLYPSPSATLAPNWAVIRATVTDSAGNGLPWAVVEVIKSDGTVAATGMTDARGEALLALVGLGLQVSTNTSGAVTETTIPVTVQAWFDKNVLTQPSGWVPDPDQLLGNLAALSTGKTAGTLALGPTMIVSAPITISV